MAARMHCSWNGKNGPRPIRAVANHAGIKWVNGNPLARACMTGGAASRGNVHPLNMNAGIPRNMPISAPNKGEAAIVPESAPNHQHAARYNKTEGSAVNDCAGVVTP